MPPDDADAHPLLHHDLMNVLTVLMGRAELLRRGVLQVDGLSLLERDQMLGNLASTPHALEQLTAQVQGMFPGTPQTDD